MFGNPVDYDEYELPDFDPEAVVEDGPVDMVNDWGSEIGSYDDLDDQSFYMLEEVNPFDGSRYEDWEG
jgi:hypothetical protein